LQRFNQRLEYEMKALRKSVLAAGAALALSGTAATLTASPASATSTVSGCTTTVRVNAAGASEASVLCTEGSGTYRAVAFLGVTSLSGDFSLRTGPIVQVGQASTFSYAIGNINGAPVRAFVGAQILS
jgi:hypothetical protein